MRRVLSKIKLTNSGTKDNNEVDSNVKMQTPKDTAKKDRKYLSRDLIQDLSLASAKFDGKRIKKESEDDHDYILDIQIKKQTPVENHGNILTSNPYCDDSGNSMAHSKLKKMPDCNENDSIATLGRSLQLH